MEFRIPKEIEIQFIKYKLSEDKSFKKYNTKISNLVIFINIFAKEHNDYKLGPYFTNQEGLISLTKEQLLEDIIKIRNSGMMDFVPIEKCFSMIEIYIPGKNEILTRVSRLKNYIDIYLKNRNENNFYFDMFNKLKDCRNINIENIIMINNSTRIRDEWCDDYYIKKYEMTSPL